MLKINVYAICIQPFFFTVQIVILALDLFLCNNHAFKNQIQGEGKNILNLYANSEELKLFFVLFMVLTIHYTCTDAVKVVATMKI